MVPKKTLKKINLILSIILSGFLLFSSFSNLSAQGPLDPNYNPNNDSGFSWDDPFWAPPANDIPGGTDLTNNQATVQGTPQSDTVNEYSYLAPLTSDFTKFDAKGECPLGKFLGTVVDLLMGIIAVLAMVMIVVGGLEYMTGELVSAKEAGKDKIRHALLGLLLALGSWLILNTINPKLLDMCLDLPTATIMISPEDTSTGSSTSLCISTTNPPNPNNATGANITLNSTMINEYIPARNSLPNVPLGVKLLITAQTAMEGFTANPPPGSVAYRTKNPGNIGNVDEHVKPRSCGPPPSKGTRCYNTLAEGIAAQAAIVTKVANNTATSYKIGSKPTCALGNETYNGSLYQYLRIYATDARMSNNYLNTIIGYFASQGKTITGNTKISEIYNMQ